MAVRKLDKFVNTITQKLFPALKETLNINIYNDPVYSSETVNTYAGETIPDDTRIKLEISSNHVELVDYIDQNVVFATIYYKARGSKVGVLNLDDINECVGLIYSTLYELGFRTQDDLEKEKREKEEKAKAEEEKKKAEAQRKREERKAKQDAEEKERLQKEQEPIEQISPEEESEQSIKESLHNFDLYLNKLRDINSPKSIIIANISFGDNNNFRLINIDMHYINNKICLVETNGINPKVNKEVTWRKAKNYISKVARALTGILSIEAIGGNGKEIDINELQDNTNGIDLNFSL